MTSLLETVTDLVELKKEGFYWDFKLKHHSHPVDLVHDIICLANTMYHKGDRYIVIGIDPETFEICGVANDTPNKQAEIIDTLCNAHFAGGNIPGVRLEDIFIDGVSVHVIVISDLNLKPYYLSKEYNKKGRSLNAGTIYSRHQDRNVDKKGVASSSEIEAMWKSRFLLDRHPKERAISYLADPLHWETLDDQLWFYKHYPEYTICLEKESVEGGLGHDRWARSCLNNDNVYYSDIELKYHQTVLWRDTTICFDGARALVVVPEFEMHRYDCNDSIMYYYLKNSLKAKVNDFLSETNSQQSNNYSVREAFENVLVFDDEHEYESFSHYLKNVKHLPDVNDKHLRTTEHEYINNTLVYLARLKKAHVDFVRQRRMQGKDV